jgi:hypothetical protein
VTGSEAALAATAVPTGDRYSVDVDDPVDTTPLNWWLD